MVKSFPHCKGRSLLFIFLTSLPPRLLSRLSLSSNRLAELKLPRLPKLEFLGAYANQLKDVPFLVQTPALQKAFLGGPSYEISEEEILRETLRLIPGIQWFNGVFVSSSRRRGLLEAMKEEK